MDVLVSSRFCKSSPTYRMFTSSAIPESYKSCSIRSFLMFSALTGHAALLSRGVTYSENPQNREVVICTTSLKDLSHSLPPLVLFHEKKKQKLKIDITSLKIIFG